MKKGWQIFWHVLVWVTLVAVLNKMQFVHTVIDEVTAESRGAAAAAG